MGKFNVEVKISEDGAGSSKPRSGFAKEIEIAICTAVGLGLLWLILKLSGGL
jgi:hypothetical protein